MCYGVQIIYINKIYNIGDTVVYNGLYGNRSVIIKIITNSPIYGIRHKTLREICSLKKFRCNNIVKLIDVRYIANDRENVTVLIYENCGKSLNSLNLEQLEAQSTIKDISYGLKYIHKLGYIHGDLNISNVTMYEENGKKTFKIIDFGNCTKSYRLSAISMPTPCITPIEMLNFENLTNVIGIDSWALGCLAYHVTTGNPLFNENTMENLKNEVVEKFYSCDSLKKGIKIQMFKHIKSLENNFIKNTTKLFNNNPQKRFSVIKFYEGVYNSNSDDKLCEKQLENNETFEKYINNTDRFFMMNMLIGVNTENSLPIENIFITFELIDKHEPKFDYKIDAILLYTLTTKLICNSHFSTSAVLDMIKKISHCEIDIIDVNKKIGQILEHYSWDLDKKTLISYLPEIHSQLKKKYIVVSTFVIYLSKYIGYSNSYKKQLICNVLNLCNKNSTKNSTKNKINVKNYHMDTNQIKNMLKLLKKNIDNDLLIEYFKTVNLLDEYKCLKLYLLNDLKFDSNR